MGSCVNKQSAVDEMKMRNEEEEQHLISMKTQTPGRNMTNVFNQLQFKRQPSKLRPTTPETDKGEVAKSR